MVNRPVCLRERKKRNERDREKYRERHRERHRKKEKRGVGMPERRDEERKKVKECIQTDRQTVRKKEEV